MYKRLFDPSETNKSYFLLGPRQTGKSTLLQSIIPESHYIDLLNPTLFVELASRPEALVEIVNARLKSSSSVVFVIDEIQKRPQLLDTVQFLISKNKGIQFILTGSSARRLKQAGQNLLGGRARRFSFHPLTLKELSTQKSNPVAEALKFGGLPGVRSSKTPKSELSDYVGVYLNEEIMAESIVRNLGAFSRFLHVAGLCNSEQINYEKVGNDSQVSGRTIRDYFEVLEDTLIGSRLEPFKPKPNRKFASSPKFYMFDVGVAHAVAKRNVETLSAADAGKALEHLIYCELKAYMSYRQVDAELFYWRTHAGAEVDFLLREAERSLIGIEVKSTTHPNDRDLAGLRALEKEVKLKQKIIVCNVDRARMTNDGCEMLPIMKFVDQLWRGEIFK